jgi:peroxiredoxin 2/4
MMKSLLFIIIISFLSTYSTSAQSQYGNIPLLGDSAPSFNARSTMGEIRFPQDYFAKWKIIFSHPADFTAVCSTEILELASLQSEFDKLKTQLLVISTDGVSSHIEWIKSLEAIDYKGRGKVKIGFPLISDVGLDISRKYGMIHPNSSETKDVRGVFIIDPDNKVRYISYYPMNIGRNTDEILRVLKALQTADKHNVLMPANWNPGDDVMLTSPATAAEAEKLEGKKNKDLYSITWYMWFKSLR